MSTVPGGETREIILPPGTYCYVQAINTGKVSTRVGPIAFTLTQQDQLVAYDAEKDKFSKSDPANAIRQTAKAAEGNYLILENPSEERDVQFPKEGSTSDSTPRLAHGRRINVPGPINFALWPGQKAHAIKGHQLRLNEYLIVRIYNAELAIQNWSKAAIAPSSSSTVPPANPDPNAKVTTEIKTAEAKKDAKVDSPASILSTAPDKLNLTNGKLLIIKGTDVSFYIPPTGVEVISENGEANTFVRNAVTLERLEYAILVDENGNKRYAHGPAVIFPEPTERFTEDTVEDGSKTRKFRAIELNAIQGLHVKVIAEYEEGGKKYNVGDELFLTGKENAIYYPRPEHSIIRYGNQTRHFATAIPAGEGRYLMNRETGEITTEAGPRMLLPDPIKEVIVRRILSEKEATLWYPGNRVALEYNQELAASAEVAGTSNANFVNDSAYRSRGGGGGGYEGVGFSGYSGISGFSGRATLGEAGPIEKSSRKVAGDSFNRGTNYTKPRTLLLDSKFDGVPQINVWTGYAVMIVDKQGGRRVEQGPCNVLLNYDETLERFALSTGKPKVTDRLHEDVYLSIYNNKVSDIVEVETKDHVRLNLKLSLVVNFEGDKPEKWFSVDNYVKLLCDHVRSVLKGRIQQTKIEDFYNNSVAIIRDIVLGKSDEKTATRPGMVFEQNGMVVRDVEVLEVVIPDGRISEMLKNAQQEVIRTNIEISGAQRLLEATKQKESISRETAMAKATTETHNRNLEIERVGGELKVVLAKIDSQIQQYGQKQKEVAASEAIAKLSLTEKLARDKAQADQNSAIALAEQQRRIEMLGAEADSIIKRFEAFDGGLAEALVVLGRDETMTKIAQATSVQAMIGGNSVVDALTKVLAGTSVGDRIGKLIAPITRSDSAAVNTRD